MTLETRNEIISWTKYILSSFVFVFILTRFVVVSAYVPSGSMLDTIPLETRMIAYRHSYAFSEPQRKDIVVFTAPDLLPENNPNIAEDSKPVLYVKRIIGIENETLEIIDGLVYINGDNIPLDEPYLKDLPKGNYGPFIIPNDHYFMMGDNRNESHDSRGWEFDNFVSKDEILGKAVFSFFPKIGLYN